MRYAAYILTDDAKQKILNEFLPKFPLVKCDHITVAFNVADDAPLPPETSDIKITGYCTDRNGIEALVIAVDGKAARPDGKPYHLTLSYDPSLPVVPALRLPGDDPAETYSSKHSQLLVRSGMNYVALSDHIAVEAKPGFQIHDPKKPPQLPPTNPPRKPQ